MLLNSNNVVVSIKLNGNKKNKILIEILENINDNEY